VIDRAKAQGRLSLIYLESPANPTNALVDVEAVRAAATPHSRKRAPADRDRQHLPGPLWQQPLRHGADLTVYSLTKYAGGHSDLVAGGVMGSKEQINAIRLMRNTIGTICDPNTLDAAALAGDAGAAHDPRGRECRQGVRVLPHAVPRWRASAISASSSRAATHARPTSTGGTAPGAGSTFSLYLKGGEKEAFAFLDALKIAKLAVSLGGTETLASHPAGMTHLSVPQERKDALKIGDNLVRISIGVEMPTI
jgi:methionine-gamma-lyase